VASRVSPASLRTARERAGLTQHQFARQIGVAGGERVSRWELGASEPRPELLARMANVLKTPAIALLDVDEETPDLRALRYCAGLSVGELADLVHVSKTTYRRWEAGRWERPPSERHIAALAKALHVTGETVLAAFAHDI
jgi:transcriptional regulator with XRE-family HTH domain